jgi:hypothetical protein
MGQGYAGDAEPGWLLVCISTGPDASLRVAVWRALRKLGAVYLQNSVALLPDQRPVSATVERLVVRVAAGGGTGRILHITLASSEAKAIVDEQRGDRDVEYTEVLERTPAFLEEIASETARGRATYTEVEESEADLARFERWLTSISDRDYFDAPAGPPARAAIESCRQALAEFEVLALAADTQTDSQVGSSRGRTLRAVTEGDGA